MAVDNRKVLQIAGGDYTDLKALSGNNAIQPRELLVSTDTNELFVGDGVGNSILVGRAKVGATADKALIAPVAGRFFFDAETNTLFVGDGTSWKLVGIDSEFEATLVEKLTTFTTGDILTVSSDGALADSGYKFNDAGTSNKDVWSAKKVQDSIFDAIRGLVWQNAVLSVVTAPPASPAAGDRYLIIGTGTGAFAGKDNQIAEWTGSAWAFTAPKDGMAVWSEDTDKFYTNNGTDWVLFGEATVFTAGNGIDITANEISAVAASNKGVSVTVSGIEVIPGNGIEVGAGGVAAKVKANSGLTVDGNGLAAVVASAGGLDVGASGLAVKIDGATLSASSAGVKVEVASAGAMTASGGLAVKVDGESVIINASNELEVNNLDFGTF